MKLSRCWGSCAECGIAVLHPGRQLHDLEFVVRVQLRLYNEAVGVGFHGLSGKFLKRQVTSSET